MAKYRELTEKNKYCIPREDYLTAIHYSLRYPLWVAEMQTNADTRGAIQYDKDRVQTSNTYDSTEAVGIKRAEISEKIDLIERTITVAAEEESLEHWLLLGVCYGLTFYQLQERGIPCGHTKYYEMRRKYYYLLSQEI